jgi:hypothetical protein
LTQFSLWLWAVFAKLLRQSQRPKRRQVGALQIKTLASKLVILPAKPGILRVLAGDCAPFFPVLPRMLRGLPRRFEGLPPMLEVLPPMFGGSPPMFEGLPRRLEGLPRRLEGLPRMLEGLPPMFGGLPRMFEGLPRRLKGLPRMFEYSHRMFCELQGRAQGIWRAAERSGDTALDLTEDSPKHTKLHERNGSVFHCGK